MNKYNLSGYDTRKQMRDCLCYLRDTEAEAIEICQQLHPFFNIEEITVDVNWNGDKEVPRIQSLV